MAFRYKMDSTSIVSFVCLLAALSQSNGYFVNVDAHSSECFFDKVTTGMKMSLTFEVVEGGFLDIDVEVYIFNAYSTVAMQRQGVF